MHSLLCRPTFWLQESCDSHVAGEAQRSGVASPRLLSCEELYLGSMLKPIGVKGQALHHYWFLVMDLDPVI